MTCQLSPGPMASSTRLLTYWEAVGVIAALRAGIDCNSVRRPLTPTKVSLWQSGDKGVVPVEILPNVVYDP